MEERAIKDGKKCYGNGVQVKGKNGNWGRKLGCEKRGCSLSPLPPLHHVSPFLYFFPVTFSSHSSSVPVPSLLILKYVPSVFIYV